MLKAPDPQSLRPLACFGLLCCLALAPSVAQDTQHPASGYLRVKLKTGLDAGHTKVGEPFQAEVVTPWVIGECALSHGARVYGQVVSATKHSRSSPESTLGLVIESVDCDRQQHTPLALHVLEIIAPDSFVTPLHAVLPTGSAGMTTAPIAHDDNTTPDDDESSLRVGKVLGESGVRLEIAEGPHFAEVLHSDKQNVILLNGTRLILGTKEMIPGDQQLHFQLGGHEP
jgi:hypothetical protein